MIPKDKINRVGRKKGSLNKNTEVVRNSFQLLVQNNLEQLQNDLNAMSPKDRFNSIVALANYILPKLNSVDYKNENIDSFRPIEIHFNNENRNL